jgi:hypothetical protein
MIGKQFFHYHIETQLGAGGMGEVYHARDTKLGRGVAVKILQQLWDRSRLYSHYVVVVSQTLGLVGSCET